MLEFSQRIFIIEESDLDDVVILDRNYKQLIRDAADPSETAMFIALRNITLTRLQTLQKEHITD
jgi:hypothetical protein